ncbi:MAG TPA: hypothetical protein VMU34_06535, partial [Mycobacterium sp.]|nr:hypothetical protein [Mycobacterium sp.]
MSDPAKPPKRRPPSAKAASRAFLDPAPEALVAPPEINPGGPVGDSIKLKDVTGPGGLTDQFG